MQVRPLLLCLLVALGSVEAAVCKNKWSEEDCSEKATKKKCKKAKKSAKILKKCKLTCFPHAPDKVNCDPPHTSAEVGTGGRESTGGGDDTKEGEDDDTTCTFCGDNPDGCSKCSCALDSLKRRHRSLLFATTPAKGGRAAAKDTKHDALKDLDGMVVDTMGESLVPYCCDLGVCRDEGWDPAA